MRWQAALDRHATNLKWYTKYARQSNVLYSSFTSAAVILAGLTPVLILIDELPKALQALPAALAAIAGGVAAVFGWHGDWLRYAATREALMHEAALLETRTGPYGPDVAEEERLASFMAAVEGLVLSETGAWKQERSQH